MPPNRSVQDLLSDSLQHARWLNRQFLIFLELKRRAVLARQASRAWWASAPAPAQLAPEAGEEDGNDWLVV